MKNDAISRSGLEKRIRVYADQVHFRGEVELANGILKSLGIIKEAPALNAVPVIRCLACAWRSATGFCGRHGHPVNDDFFCAHGTTEIVRKPGPAKKTEKKTEERCGSTGLPCSRCMPGPCDHRRMVIPDGSGQ